MIDIQWNVHDSMDNANGSFSLFADAVDSTTCRLYWASAAGDLQSGAYCLPIHWLDIELGCCRNFQRIDVGPVSMVNSQLAPHRTFHWPESLN